MTGGRRSGLALCALLLLLLATTLLGGLVGRSGATTPRVYAYDSSTHNVPARVAAIGAAMSPTFGGEDGRERSLRSMPRPVPLRDAAETEPGLANDLAQACSANSFAAATPVLLASGTEIPISTVKIGDKVLATDPQTGRTAARPVTSIIVHSGAHTMVDVTLADGTTLTATDHHPFWDATTSQFTYAADLHIGDQVREANGQRIAVANVRNNDENVTAYNLTVDGIHTFYAGTTPVLVHNSCADGARLVSSRAGIIDTGSPALQQQAESVANEFLQSGQVPNWIRQGAFQGQQGVFGNVAGDLPTQPAGYYNEMDVWPGSGPRGTERLVIGGGGEAWYSPATTARSGRCSHDARLDHAAARTISGQVGPLSGSKVEPSTAARGIREAGRARVGCRHRAHSLAARVLRRIPQGCSAAGVVRLRMGLALRRVRRAACQQRVPNGPPHCRSA